MGLLEGKIAVVTGSGRGIGRAIAIAFAAEGAAVALAARTKNEIGNAAEEIRIRGGRALAISTDLTHQEDIDALFTNVQEELGQVDILVNNAATNGPIGMIWQTDPALWLDAYNVNVVSMVRCVQAVLPGMMKNRYGKIIMVGSIAGWSDSWAASNLEQTAYALTKAAIIRFSSCLAQQVRSYRINVNCVGVGAYTRLGDKTYKELARLRGEAPPPTLDEIPAENRTLPEENVGSFIFLASPLSDHVTGTYIEANSLPDPLPRR